MKEIKRLTDEIWTSYLIRTLEFNDIKVYDYEKVSDNNLLTSTYNGVLDIERFINMDNIMDKHFVFGCFDRACLEERAFVTFPPAKIQSEYDLEFYFQLSGLTKVIYRHDFSLEGLLSKYQNGKEYDSVSVIQDLVTFVKSPDKSKIIMDNY